MNTESWGGALVREWTDPVSGVRWHVRVLRMLVNHRVVMISEGDQLSCEHGWCYRSLAAAILGTLGWDMDAEDEPPGWHKRAMRPPRQAPERTPCAPLRCDHGSYDNRCAVIDCEHFPMGLLW